MTQARTREAALYLRQSHGRQRSIAEQETSGRATCETQGWAIHGVYTDTISASRFARKVRPDWARLLAGLGAGSFGVLWMWESSRGDRELESWAGMLRRCRDHQVLIHVETHGRTYDMANGRDWRTLAEDGVDSAYEVEKLSLRNRRAAAAAAVAGKPHGIVQYGFERIYDERTRELIEQREQREQAPVVREIIGSIAAGMPVSVLEASLNNRGIPSARGGKWTRAQIRQIATNAAYIGKRRSGVHNPGGPVLYDAMWPAIVEEETFWTAQRILGDPERKHTRPGAQKHLLSYFARCDECGALLFVAGVYYKCSDHGCVYIRVEGLNGYVLTELIAMVRQLCDREEFLAAAFPETGQDAAKARAEAVRLQALLDDYTRRAGREELTPEQLASLTSDLLPKIRIAAERARSMAAPPPLRGLLALRDQAERDVITGAVADKRDLIKALMASVRVRKAPAGNPREIAGRVLIRWVWENGQTP